MRYCACKQEKSGMAEIGRHNVQPKGPGRGQTRNWKIMHIRSDKLGSIRHACIEYRRHACLSCKTGGKQWLRAHHCLNYLVTAKAIVVEASVTLVAYTTARSEARPACLTFSIKLPRCRYNSTSRVPYKYLKSNYYPCRECHQLLLASAACQKKWIEA